jgi:hypothetical protein
MGRSKRPEKKPLLSGFLLYKYLVSGFSTDLGVSAFFA